MNSQHSVFENGPLPENNKDYYLWRAKNINDKRLFIVFSSRGAKPGDFSFYKTFDSLSVNVLHITPPDFTWYHSGLVGFGDDIDSAYFKLIEHINIFCHFIGIKDVMVFGASMGGYGALLYGVLSKSDLNVKILAFGTETVLKLPNSKSLESDFIVSERYKNIKGIVSGRNKINMIFGEFNLVDSYCALNLKSELGVDLYSHSFSDHDVPVVINNSVGMVDFLTSLINDNFFFIGRGQMAQALNADDIYPLLFEEQFSKEYMAALEKCLKKYPAYGYGLNRLGVYLHKENDLEESEKILKSSLVINPNYKNTLTHHEMVKKKLLKTK